MGASTVNPQQVFRSALPVGSSLVVLFVPSKDRDGQPIDQEHWVDEVVRTLGRLFRGPPLTRAARAFGGMTSAAARC